MSYPVPDIYYSMTKDSFNAANATGDEEILDWNMESADTDSWIVSSIGATMSKVSNGEGGQALRLTNASSVDPNITQILTATNGNRYTWAIRVRTDGINSGWIGLDVGKTHEIAASDEWQVFKFDAETIAGFQLRLGFIGSGTGFVEFDYVTVKTCEACFLNQGVASGKDLVLGEGGGSPLYFPDIQDDIGLRFNTPTDRAYARSPNFGSVPFAVSHMLTLGSYATAYPSRITSIGKTFYFLLFIYSGGVAYLYFYVGSNTGPVFARYTLPFKEGTKVNLHIVGQYTGASTEIYINGIRGLNASTPTAPDYEDGQDITLTSTSTGWDGVFGPSRWWFGKYLSQSEITKLYQDDIREYARLHI